ncbi:endonuclease domain-containing protein [Nocardia sp. NPDC059180]|uniref:endonuclease domain-containing protein n=1 Tax=Nocardia sp. NPDC059180 TaxID=3346761 RepID=UPI0036A59A99
MTLARLDMGWRRWHVAVEYDGAQHWTDRSQRSWDIDRQAILNALGWTIVHVGADQLDHRPDTIVSRTTHALRAHGAELPDR